MSNSLVLTLLLSLLIGTSKAQEKIAFKGEIPILAWYSIPENQITLERFQELKDAGITYSFSGYSSADAVQKALDIAAKVGVKIVVSCPELRTDPEKTANRFVNHPATAGYHLQDEPPFGQLKGLGEWARKIQTIDKKHFCYVNLFPNHADSTQLGTKLYIDYIKEYTKQIPMQFISFDYYPILKDRISKTWYQNLEQIAEEGKASKLPFWAFALTTNYDEDHLTPQSLAAMRLQVYSDLAYGAQGIQYFTYWSATSTNAPSGEDQRGAPITATGKRSVVYDRVKLMSQEIKALSGVFMGAKVLSVRHSSKGMIPLGTIRLTALPKAIRVLESNGEPMLVSVLENGSNSFAIIVNKNHLASINLTVAGDETLKKVLKDGTVVPASSYENALELDAGDAAIYMFPTEKK